MADDVKKVVAAGNNNGRKVVGTGNPGVLNYFQNNSTENLQPKKGEVKADPLGIGAGTQAVRKQRAGKETYGAAYSIKQVMPAQTPQAQQTQANGRIIPATHRVGKGFYSQAAGL